MGQCGVKSPLVNVEEEAGSPNTHVSHLGRCDCHVAAAPRKGIFLPPASFLILPLPFVTFPKAELTSPSAPSPPPASQAISAWPSLVLPGVTLHLNLHLYLLLLGL